MAAIHSGSPVAPLELWQEYRLSRRRYLTCFIVLLTIILLTDSVSSSQRESATSQPTSQAAIPAEIDSLIRQLGDRTFQTREDAQKKLAALGPVAAPHLAGFITDPNPEIATRVSMLLGTPSDPGARVLVAIRLIESTDPDWMERGVHMLFADPASVFENFMERTKDAIGIRRIIFDPIREQMLSWKRQDDLFQRNYEKAREKDSARAEQMRKTHADTRLYCAEAAYWGAYEAFIEEKERETGKDGDPDPPPSTRPAQ